MQDHFTEILSEATLEYFRTGCDEPSVCAYLNEYSYSTICTCKHMVDSMPFLSENMKPVMKRCIDAVIVYKSIYGDGRSR